MGEHYDFDLGGTLLDSTEAADWGDLHISDDNVEKNRATIRDHVSAVLEQGAVPMLLGGDGSVPIPCLQAFEGHGPITILPLVIGPAPGGFSQTEASDGGLGSNSL